MSGPATGLAAVALLTALVSCNGQPSETTGPQSSVVSATSTVPPIAVQTFGELHKIMHEGETGPSVRIQDALSEPHSLAVGALSELRGEVTIRDGVVWLAYPDGERARVVQDAATSEQATLFVVSHVAHWQTLPVAAPVPLAELDAFIETQAIAAGIDAQLVGFFGQNAQGVFTHMGQRSHFHVVEPSSNISGHVDELEVARGARLMLPAPSP